MNKRLRLIIIVLGLILLTPPGLWIGHRLYYHSDRYRRTLQTELTAFLGLPVDIEQTEADGWSGLRLTGITIWLPGRRAVVMQAPLALWSEDESAGDGGTSLDIFEAKMNVGSPAWETEDYMRVLRGSLRHDFTLLNLRRIRLHDSQIIWPREEFRLAARKVDGTIHFDKQGQGAAELTCSSLNDQPVAEPVRITARIDPDSEQLIPLVTLQIPTFPLPALQLDQLLHAPITSGSFSGTVTLRQDSQDREVELSGTAREVQLAELTTRLAGGPIPAWVDLNIERLRIENHRLAELLFNGEVRQLEVNPLLKRFTLPEVGGVMNLFVHRGEIVDDRVALLGLSGEWNDGSIDILARQFLGRSGIRGRLRVRLHALIIKNNEPTSGNIDVLVEPSSGAAGTIDRELLMHMINKYLGVSLPEMITMMLPAEVPFSQMGAKLLLDRQQLRVLSLTGPAGQALITIPAPSGDLPLLGSLDQVYSLEEWLSRVRLHVRELEEQWKKRLLQRPAAQPAGSKPAR